MKPSIACLTTLALLLAACGGGADSTSETTLAVDPEAVVLAVTSEGGFVPVEFNLDRMPRFLLTADGTLFSQGAVPAIFPGPLMPNVQVTSIDDDVWDEIRRLVEEIGLAEIDERIDDSGAEMIADAPTDFITYHDEAGSHRLGIYALGLTPGGAGSSDRLLAGELVEILDEAAASGGSTTYEPEMLQVAAGPGAEEPGMSTVEPWPLDVAFEEMEEWGLGWKCTTVEGEPVAGLLETFNAANQATLWDTGSETLGMRARPLLPGEEGCTGAPAG